MWHQCIICHSHCNDTICKTCSSLFYKPFNILDVTISVYYWPVEECCVCYESTLNRTPCKHYVCTDCIDQISNGQCPLCRTIINDIEQRQKDDESVSLWIINQAEIIVAIEQFPDLINNIVAFTQNGHTFFMIAATPNQNNYFSHLLEHLITDITP